MIVTLSWKIEERNKDRLLRVIWRETNGPAVTTPQQTAFGSTLIDCGIPNGTVNREFGTDGMVYTIELAPSRP
jgi:two-component sensor histidine kinase